MAEMSRNILVRMEKAGPLAAAAQPQAVLLASHKPALPIAVVTDCVTGRYYDPVRHYNWTKAVGPL